MKILELRIKDFQQFQDIKLDFTDKNGNPLNKICFIGKNGTGKSTILKIINDIIQNINDTNFKFSLSLYLKVLVSGNIFYFFSSSIIGRTYIFSDEIEKEKNWFKDLPTVRKNIEHELNFGYLKKYILDINKRSDFIGKVGLKNNSNDLLIYSPPESIINNYMRVGDVPDTNLNEALTLMKTFPFHHIISDDKVNEFWKVLIYLIKKRDNEREQYEIKPENINKTKNQLIKEFDENNPKILDKLSVLWNKILGQAGLEFDLETVSNPVQLTDNLRAYIRLKSSKQRILYNHLSTGIRNFIFRVGHIYSLYFNREIKNGFLLLDEPENSLFPDFLFDLIETYQEIVIDKNGENNTQFFVSTHNPIIAAQFKPEERIILEWNEEGFVDAYKGIAPVGDDPNDVLMKDFKLKHLMGKEGQKVWEEYLNLRKKLKKTENKTEKDKIISEINRIGELYNFED